MKGMRRVCVEIDTKRGAGLFVDKTRFTSVITIIADADFNHAF